MRWGATGLFWNVESTAAGLKRVEPVFTTSGIIERLDVHPSLSYPLSGRGWNFTADGWGAGDVLQPEPGDAVYAGAAGGEYAAQ